MARLSENSFFHGTSGSLGELVFRTRNGKTYVSLKPRPRNETGSALQKTVQNNFTRCAQYAKKAIRDPELKQLYQFAATDHQTAYNVAVADASGSPQVINIDTSRYKGKSTDSITVEAIDNFKVQHVIVMIYKPNGAMLEIGYAEAGEEPFCWIYTPRVLNKSTKGCRIKAIASDLPGNEGELEVTL